LLEKHPSSANDSEQPEAEQPGPGRLHQFFFFFGLAYPLFNSIGLYGWRMYQGGHVYRTFWEIWWQNAITSGIAWICAYQVLKYYCSPGRVTLWD
jgi:hypothetical protein